MIQCVFSTENNQKLAFSDPSPPTSDYVIYEWSLRCSKSFFFVFLEFSRVHLYLSKAWAFLINSKILTDYFFLTYSHINILSNH
jgi:hypothetical protein